MLNKHWEIDTSHNECLLSLYKITLYEAGGDHFDWHRDAVHDRGHIATVEVALESQDLIGGSLQYRDFRFDPAASGRAEQDDNGQQQRDEDVRKSAEYRGADMMKIHVFYTDTEHCIEPVKSGFRVALEYELIIGDAVTIRRPSMSINQGTITFDEERRMSLGGDYEEYADMGKMLAEQQASAKSALSYETSSINPLDVQELLTFLNSCVSSKATPGLMMSHLYPGMAGVSRDILRGYDRLLYDILVSHFDIELEPVCLFTEMDSSRVVRCVSLEKSLYRRSIHDLTLYVTPTAIQCMDTIGGALLDNKDDSSNSQLNYTAMAMILNDRSSAL